MPTVRPSRRPKTTTTTDDKQRTPPMKDLLGLMGKAKEMQAKFQAMQDEIAARYGNVNKASVGAIQRRLQCIAEAAPALQHRAR